ncbi:endonuclease/exonuclease/phosphatase family protein [Robiginitalea sp. SC105]|uniref:endonuclease/exonuclease/phosphatase family protein n=1 Tax=Robiginitalea sp. SC105 TaxID=2762332 RepID=UPI00163A1435|nr:endonuclease/exonuclease/phosphatase family protein [Robiginitalea sp. SC105]MBC2840117.1 endonuclease/exonuclease/phosphatase family protein [Robiginitalea sp. SC105]
MALKVSTWNIEHASELLDDNPSSNITDRIRRIEETITEIDPDILLIVEGPKGEKAISDFCHVVLNDQWVPVLLKGTNDALGDLDRDYGHDMRGTQWMWFVVKPGILSKCRIQPASVWRSFIGDSTWSVNYWGQIQAEDHDHYRMPQVLIYDMGGGHEMELIGVHLKSKINRESITRDAQGNLTGAYLETALKARVKLATEARNIRNYIDVKFNQLPNPGIIVLGDCNDGPGNDLFEYQYLFFDLIQNLQGEVLLAERYFNHALFDFPGDLRWTAKFRNPIKEIPTSQNPLLLDHILMSQPLCNGSLPLKVNAGNGSVEHQAFERANAGSNSSTRSSDHRPVSCTLNTNH